MSDITQNGALKRDDNDHPVMGGTSSSDNATIINAAFDPVTRRLLTDTAGGGTGTVTEVDTGTGLTGGPITTTGTISLDSKLAPLDTLGTAGQLIRVNAGATALEYFTASAGGVSSVVGTANRITVDSTDPANPVVDIAATYVGQTSITTLGTITTGTWNGTTIAVAHGGTGGTSASITLFNNITGFTASGSTGTTSTNLVFSTSPTLVTPTLGVASATSINKVTITAPATSATLTIADGKTLTVSNTLTFTGTDTSSVAFGTGGTVLYAASTIPLTVGSTTITSGTNTRVLFDNSGVLGEYTISGSGSVAMTTSPTFTTPTLGAATATSINGLTITSSTGTLTITNAKTVSFSNTIIFAGTDSTTMTFPTTSATIARTDAAQTFTGVQTFSSAPVLSTNTLTGNGNLMTFPGSAQTLVGRADTVTLTNKRITRRVVTVNAPGATPTTNTDNNDIADFTGLAANITSMTTNLSGTPVDGDLIEFRFLDNGSARSITWGTSFAATTVALPTTTVISTTLRVGFEWLASASKWQCIATC